ncbi:MAG: immunoglobulin domain-containing protein, partial [Candidatus Acidiferrum sp.]
MNMSRRLEGFKRNLAGVTALAALAFCISGCAGIADSKTKVDPPAGSPAISGVTPSQVTSSGATISWNTDQASSSQVNYGTTASYGTNTTLNSSMVSSHSASLSGLKSATLYHYRVNSSNAAGNLATSGDFTFTTASGSDTTPPTVSISSPASGAIASGTITLTATASDNVGVAGVQFQVDNVNSGADDTVAPYTLALDTTKLSNGNHSLTAVASDAAGNHTTSAAVSITVVNLPVITSQPASQTVTVGQTATFVVAATGAAPLTYQWKKNGTSISGATASSYTTPATISANNGSTFQVVVSNAAGSTPSATVTLTVDTAAVAPTITSQPVNQTVTAGQTATFSVVATGTAPLTYQWKKNSANIAGATAASYTTPVTTSADNGSTFQVVVSNGTGSAPSTTVTLTVNAAAVAPTIITQPVNQTVTAGQTATFSVVATGTAPLSYQWSKNGANITGATSATYTTPATTSTDDGSTFQVVVSNGTGSTPSNIVTLTVASSGGGPGTAALVQHVSSSNTRGGGSVNNAFTSPYCYHFQLPNF